MNFTAVVKPKLIYYQYKNYSCICQFGSLFDNITLHQIKHDTKKIRSYYGEILKVVCEAKILGCNDFLDEDVLYSVKSEGKCVFFNLENEISFLFYL